MPELNVLEQLKEYVGFGADDVAALRGVAASIEPSFAGVAETFYARILEHPDDRAVLSHGESSVGKLKGTLVEWMRGLFSGEYGQEYFDRRSRIGRVHVRIGMPQHFMFGAMAVVRAGLVRAVISLGMTEAKQHERTLLALHRILDLELAVMLHTYREDQLAQQARSERLATYGQLVGTVSHELRNPLSVIDTSAYLLKARVESDPRSMQHVERIASQVRTASDIINQLLSMIQSRDVVHETVDLCDIIDAAAETCPGLAAVRFTREGLDQPISVSGDATQLGQVFKNLFQNALEAVQADPAVSVHAQAAGSRVVVSVHDNGTGVDAAIKDRLFEPLVTSKPRGVGLGLALVKRVIEAHGGSIRAGERPLGGAMFEINLPTTRTAA